MSKKASHLCLEKKFQAVLETFDPDKCLYQINTIGTAQPYTLLHSLT